MTTQEPRLRSGVKTNPLYPLNHFPAAFKHRLAANLVYHLATRPTADLEGKDWEQIFADCINAHWTPSNFGLDDITHRESSTAWGAKTVKTSTVARNSNWLYGRSLRLISGRNSPTYSFGQVVDPKSTDVSTLGKMVLDIWNYRVREVRSKFDNLRTVVLVKGADLLSVAVFEVDTNLFIAEDYRWEWNSNDNLEGFDSQGNKKFTWQPHGSQFTIVEKVPNNVLRLRIRKPDQLSKESVLQQLNFNQSFYEEF